MKIAITPHTFAHWGQEPLDLLQQAGLDYVLNTMGRRATEDETIAMLDGCIGLISGNGPVTSRLIDACPNLKVISHCGATADNIDINYAESKGINVTIAPNGHAISVAEMAVSCMLALLRGIPKMDHQVKVGLWKRRMGSLLQKKRVGIIGFGSTGQTLKHLLDPFDVDIAYTDPHVDSAETRKMELDELLSWADVVTLHCPRVEGGCLINAAHLAKMRKGSIIMNLAKPGLVDEDALNGLLMADHLGGAALDVFENEPYEGPLCQRDNVILTPHIAFNARESRIIMDCEAVKNMINGLKGLTA